MESLQPGSFGQVDAEPVATPLIAAGHLGRGVPKLLLDIPFVHLCRRGETRAQRMAGKQRDALFLGHVGADSGLQHGLLDQSGHVLVRKAGVKGTFAVSRRAYKHRSEIDLGEVEPLFEGMNGSSVGKRCASSSKAT